jgi:hypothetical protein
VISLKGIKAMQLSGAHRFFITLFLLQTAQIHHKALLIFPGSAPN